MKHSIHFILLLLFSSFWVNAQKTTISENPIAYEYLLKHYGLKGKVKSVTSYGSNNYLMTDELFDQEGRRTTLVGYSGMPTTTNYTYDKSNNTIKLAQLNGNLPPFYYMYKYNSNQEVEFSLYKEGHPLRKFDYRGNLLIKDSSAKRYSTQKEYYSYYEYNSKGQLTRLWDFDGGGKLGREEVYSYEGNVVTVKGKSYPSFAGGTVSEYEKKKYYNSKGSLMKQLFTENSKTETTEYKLDAIGNWIWKTGGITRKIAYYDSVQATKKDIGKPDIIAKQFLLLDEKFDNNNNKWTVWDGEGSAAQIFNSNYRFTAKQNNNYLSWLGVSGLASNQSKDFTIETKLFLNSTEKGNINDSYWLLWGLGNSGKDYYAFGIYPEGKFQYGKLVNGFWDAKAGSIYSTSIKAGINNANVLRVEKNKDKILFFINGIEVHKATYESFNINYGGVGFQVNNKKILDIDYLKITQGTEATTVATLSPEPYESNYLKALANSNNSNERANAIIDYYLAVKPLNYTPEKLEKLFGQKFIEMMDIDYHGFLNVLWSKRINAEVIKVFVKASEVLTKEQRDGIKLIAQYTVDNYVAKENNTPKPAYPAGVPQPGYGWGKMVSSNKAATSANNLSKPVEIKPVQVDELTQLKNEMNDLKGKWVYLSRQGKHYYVQKNYTLNSLSDQIMLKEIQAAFTYDSYKARNVFSLRYSDANTYTLPVTELANALYTKTNSYTVTRIYQCSGCLGRGGSWNNNTRLGASCKTCGGSGCVSSMDGFGYSNMPYADFIY